MRFHCGISFRPKLSWFKWLLLPLLGLLTYFGIFTTQVLAATGSLSPTSVELCNSSTGSCSTNWLERYEGTSSIRYQSISGYSAISSFNVNYDSSVFSYFCYEDQYKFHANYELQYRITYRGVDPNVNGSIAGVQVFANNSRIASRTSVDSSTGIATVKFDYPGYGTNIRIKVDQSPSNVYAYPLALYTFKDATITCTDQTTLSSVNQSIESSTNNIISNNQQNTETITNNQNQNTQSIINNNNTNTNNIINNNNQNTQAIIDSNKYCSSFEPVVELENSYLVDSGGIGHSNGFGVSKYYSFSSDLTIGNSSSVNGMFICFYTSSKTFISCSNLTGLSEGSIISNPSNSRFFRYTIDYRNQPLKPTINYCINGSQAVNDSINDSNVDGSGAGHFFGDYHLDDTRGFSNIVLAPIEFLRNIITYQDTCTQLSLPLRMKDDNIDTGVHNLTVPCGDILWDRAGSLESIWFILVWGIIGYRVLIDLVKFVNTIINPENTKEYFMEL